MHRAPRISAYPVLPTQQLLALEAPRQASALFRRVCKRVHPKSASFLTQLIAASVLAGFTMYPGIYPTSVTYDSFPVPNVTYCAIRCSNDLACNSFSFKYFPLSFVSACPIADTTLRSTSNAVCAFFYDSMASGLGNAIQPSTLSNLYTRITPSMLSHLVSPNIVTG